MIARIYQWQRGRYTAGSAVQDVARYGYRTMSKLVQVVVKLVPEALVIANVETSQSIA